MEKKNVLNVTTTNSSSKLSAGYLQPLVQEEDLANTWKSWLIHFIFYIKASGVKKKGDKRKIATMLHYLGN